MRKTVAVAAGVAGAVLIAGHWPDITRYVKIRQMSFGSGHPQNVPAHGRTSYPGRRGLTATTRT